MIRTSLERLTPVLMTALSAGLALVPLLIDTLLNPVLLLGLGRRVFVRP